MQPQFEAVETRTSSFKTVTAIIILNPIPTSILSTVHILAEAATAIKTAEDLREDNAEVDTVADPILELAQEPRSVMSV